MNTVADVVESDQLRERGYFVEIDHPVAGKWKYPGAPVKTSFNGWQWRRPAPLLGQHTAEVLQTLGIDEAAMAELQRSGII